MRCALYPAVLSIFAALSFAACMADRSVSGHSAGDPFDGLKEGIKGIVTESSGRPVADVVVDAASLGPKGPAVPDLAVVTDEDGRYAWRLEPGLYAISIRRTGCEVFAAKVEVTHERVTRLDVRLQCRGESN